MKKATLGAILGLGLVGTSPAQPPAPGYGGTFPSPAGKQALEELYGTVWEDEDKLLGGGEWRIERGGVTPHPLGPGRGDVMEMRSAGTKGPHVRLVQGRLAFFFPTRSDGDVAELFRLLGRKVAADLEGEPSPELEAALAGLRGLGEKVRGIRVGVAATAPRAGRNPRVRILVWNCSDEPVAWTGSAELRVDGTPVAVELRWPPKLEAPGGASRLRLEPGSTYELETEVAALAAPGPHELQLALIAPPDKEGNRPAEPLVSAKVRIAGEDRDE